MGSLRAHTHLCISSCLEEPLPEVLLLHLRSGAPRTALLIHLLVGQHCLVHGVPVNQGLYQPRNKTVRTLKDPSRLLPGEESANAAPLLWDLRNLHPLGVSEYHAARKPSASCKKRRARPPCHPLIRIRFRRKL